MASRPSASEQAKESALLHLLAARIPAAVWSTDADLRMTSVFGAALAGIGVPPGDLVGKTLFEIAQTDDEDFPGVAAHRRALRGESVDYDRHWMEHTYRCHVERLTDQSVPSSAVSGLPKMSRNNCGPSRHCEKARSGIAIWQNPVRTRSGAPMPRESG